MEFYKFSPITDKDKLFKAIKYTHIACFNLCYQAFGEYLPAAGNIGIFCHYDDEFNYLTKLRQEITNEADNWNKKYYRLYKPITISAIGDIPLITYTHLYIRKPDDKKPQVGDVDLVMVKNKFEEYKKISFETGKIGKTESLYRPDLDMIRISKSEIDALLYITTTFMNQK